MQKLNRHYRQYMRAFIADNPTIMRQAYIAFEQRFPIVLAQFSDDDRVTTRKKRRELDPDREKEIEQETGEEQKSRSGNVKELGQEMQRTMMEYAEEISQYREGVKDLAGMMAGDDFLAALRERSENQRADSLQEEDIKVVVEAYNSIDSTMRDVQRHIIKISKGLNVLWTPIRHLPEFLSRWVQQGDKSSKEKANERELYRSTFEKGRILDVLDKSKHTLDDAAQAVRQRMRRSRAIQKSQDFLDKQQAKELETALMKGILKGEPKDAITDILQTAEEEWDIDDFEGFKNSLANSGFAQDIFDIGNEAAESLDLQAERTAALHSYMLLRVAQQSAIIKQLEQLEDKADSIIGEWAETSYRFISRLNSLADSLQEAYGDKGKFEKQLAFLQKVFTEGDVLGQLVNGSVKKVTTLLEYADRLLNPMLSEEDRSEALDDLEDVAQLEREEPEQEEGEEEEQGPVQMVDQALQRFVELLNESTAEQLDYSALASAYMLEKTNFVEAVEQDNPDASSYPIPESLRDLYKETMQEASGTVATKVAKETSSMIEVAADNEINRISSDLEVQIERMRDQELLNKEGLEQTFVGIMQDFQESLLGLERELDQMGIPKALHDEWIKEWTPKAKTIPNLPVIIGGNEGALQLSKRTVEVEGATLLQHFKEQYRQLISDTFREEERAIQEILAHLSFRIVLALRRTQRKQLLQAVC